MYSTFGGLAAIERAVEETARRYPMRRALIGTGWYLTYAELLAEIRRMESHLRGHRLPPNCRVMISGKSPVFFLCASMAAWSANHSVVVMGGRMTSREIDDLADITGPALMILPPNRRESSASGPPCPRTSSGVRCCDMTGDVGGYPSQERSAAQCKTPGGEAIVLRTSGSTGIAKGVSLSSTARLRCITDIANAYELRDHETLLVSTPVTHSAGMTFAMAQLLVGGSVAIPDSYGADTLSLIAERSCSARVLGVPLTVERMLARPDRLGRIGQYIVMGAPLSPMIRTKVHSLLPTTEIVEYYGCSEHPHIAWVRYRKNDASVSPGRMKLFSQVEVRIVDSDGAVIKDGRKGAVQVRGPYMMKGYVHGPNNLETVTGWVAPGDDGRLDGRWLEIAGRSDQVLLVGGVNVYPSEVERVLDEVYGVEKCVVVGIPDEIYGTTLVALIVPSQPAAGHRSKEGRREISVDEESLRAVSERMLEPSKRPRAFVILGNGLPTNAMGKSSRAELIAIAEDAIRRTR